MIAATLRMMIEHEKNWELHSCIQGAKALEIALRLKPAVILQDLLLPDIDAMALLEQYGKQSALAESSIIVLSGVDDPELKSKAFALGACDFMVKMPSADEVLARLRHHIRTHQASVVRNNAMQQLITSENELRIVSEAHHHLLEKERLHLAAFDRLTRLLSEVTDLDVLLRRLLAEARNMFSCEAGSILLHVDDHLVFTYAQNDVLNVETRFPDSKKSPVILPIDHSSIAGAGAVEGLVVVQDAYNIPTDSPFQFNSSFDKSSGFRTRAVIALAMRDAQGRLLGVLQLINPRASKVHDSLGFTEDDQKVARHIAGLAAMALERSQLTRSMILRMMRMAEMRDPKETGAHVKRVAEVSARLFEHWGRKHQMPQKHMDRQLDMLRTAAMLHDMGKVGILDAVLKKPGKLDAQERADMEKHPLIGAQILSDGVSSGGFVSALDEAICNVMLYHQAKWNGTGYPAHADIIEAMKVFGKQPSEVPQPKGEHIPLFARIVCIADVFDALISLRAYKEPWPPAKVKATIQEEAGKHFDPELAQIFCEHFEEMCEANRMFAE